MTVPSYWVNYLFGGGGYSATHSYSFQSCLMTEASKYQDPKYTALALGNAAHQLEDSVLHNNEIPNVIIATQIQNIPIHPVWESMELSVTYQNDPTIATRASTALNPLLNDPVALQIWTTCSGQQAALQGFNVLSALQFENSALASPDSWFTKFFGLPDIYKSVAFGDSTSGILAIVVAIVLIYILFVRYDHKVIGAILVGFFLFGGIFMLSGGLYSLADKSNVATMQQLSIDRVLSVFQTQNWNTRVNYDATGFSLLHQADAQVMTTWYIIFGIIILAVAYLIYKHFH